MSLRRMRNETTPYERHIARLYLMGGGIAGIWFIAGMTYLYGVGRFW